MQNLHVYFDIAFLADDVIPTRMLKFAARSLPRLSASNPSNAFDTVIASTTLALAACETGQTDVGTKEAIKIAKTQIKDDFRGNLPAQIRRIFGAVAGAYGDPSPELTECFPEGRSGISRCRDEELNNKMGALVTCITPKQPQVGATIVTLATSLKTQWEQIFAAQDNAMSAHELSADQVDAKLQSLAVELYKCVLTVALQFPGDIGKCDYYFPQQYLRRPAPRTVPDQAELTADPFNAVTHKVLLHGFAEGAEQIRFQRRLQGENDFSVIATVDAEEGSADFEDTLLNNGTYQYEAIGIRGSAEGDASPILAVTAA